MNWLDRQLFAISSTTVYCAKKSMQNKFKPTSVAETKHGKNEKLIKRQYWGSNPNLRR